MTRVRALGLFALVAIMAALVLCPLAAGIAIAGLGKSGLSARAASGTIWSGTLADARFGMVPLGDVHVGLNPLPLLAGRAELGVSGAAGTGRLVAASGTRGIANVDAKLTLANALAPLPIDTLEFSDVTVGFKGELCDRAEGRVRATFGADVAGMGVTGLSGTVRCAGDEVSLPLVSQSGTQRLTVHVTADNHWRAVFSLATADPVLGAKLTAAGFRPSPTGYVLRLSGSF